MPHVDSVTEWLAQLKAGDPPSSQPIWERYVDQLVRRARKKLGSTPRRASDEDDVVQSAFDGFFRGVKDGRFPRLDDRDDLWQVLVMLTDRKAVDHRRRGLADKRGRGTVRGDSAFAGRSESGSHPHGINQLIGRDATPEFAVLVAEEFEQLLGSLAGERLRQIAVAKMEGLTIDELADELGISPSTVQRKLRLIRRTWSKEGRP